jgi:AAA domain/Calcineurin-like phosphoesterase
MRSKQITLGPTLVVLVGPSGAGKSTWALEHFSKNEIVSSDALREEYLDDSRRQDEEDQIFNEFDDRIRKRLERGLRVVADATHIRNTNRKRTAKLAEPYGARVIYVVINRSIMAKLNHGGWRNQTFVDGKNLIMRHEETFVANEKTILAGDGGLARTVFDIRSENPDIVYPLTRKHDVLSPEQAAIADIVSRNYAGILFIGDVHGNKAGLIKMIRHATAENLYMIFMGDLVDYATDTLETADMVARLVFQGRASAIFGNHEKKIHKYVTRERIDGVYANLTGFDGNLSSGNDVTVNQLKAMSAADRFAWETRFLGLCQQMPHMIRLPGYVLAHGAVETHMLDEDYPFRFLPESAQESFAMFGQTTGKVVNGFPERVYDWVDQLPPRLTAIVGHDCRQETEPFVQQGAAGGRAIFLDTGSSKPERFAEGHLSAMSLRITSRRKMGYILENERFISEHDVGA